MNHLRSNVNQHGFVLVMLILVLVLLLGIAALALDLGRIYVLRTEMQNAADAAALAAAKELDAKSDAIERARLAGKDLLVADSHFTRVKELLGPEVPAVDIRFEFFCSIGNKFEQGIENLGALCTGDGEAEPPKINVPTDADDEQAHYVRVTLDPELTDTSGRYGIDLFFLPVLSLLGIETERYINLTANALAGRHYYTCRYPPVMLCDPFEGSGGLRNNITPGQQIALKLQGGPNASWAPGMFGYLDPNRSPGGGTGEVIGPLANEGEMYCTPPEVMPETGNMAAPGSAAINTRFDEYGPPHFNHSSDPVTYPPAPNITSYGGYDNDPDNIDGKLVWRDENLRDLSDLVEGSRIGNGVWDRNDYFTENHSGVAWPTGWPSMTRWETYNWEITQGYIPREPTHTPGAINRRVLYLAVLSCNALGVKPNEVIPIIEPDGFAKLFITERAGDPPNSDLLVEFMGWASERDEDYRVVVQLYE